MRTVVIFPGRFQPFHRGHMATYQNLAKKFSPEDVYVATSNSQAPVTSPFNFGEKQFIINKVGVPTDKILQIARPYNITEIIDRFGTDDIAIVFAVSDKDRERIVKLLSNEYYEPYPDNGRVKPVSRTGRAYVLATPIVPFKIKGINADSAKQIRDQYLKNNSAGRDQIIKDLLGNVDANVREMFDRALGRTEKVEEFVNEVRQRPTRQGKKLLERVLQLEVAVKEEENRIKINRSQRAQAWIDKVYDLYPGTFQNNHVMSWGEGDDQQFAMFELVPSMSRRDAVEVKWFQAYPLRQGVGSRAMAELQRLAQEDGIALTLYPWDKGQVSQAKLMKFYRGKGFRPTARGSKSMAWEPVKENNDELFAPAKPGSTKIAGWLHDNDFQSHHIIGPQSLVDALIMTNAPPYFNRLVTKLNWDEQVELADEVADILWNQWDQHTWEPEDEIDLDENTDDLFEPSIRSKILQVLQTRQAEIKNIADRDPRFGVKESAQQLYMDYREFMRALNKNFDGVMRSLFDIDATHDLPENAVDDVIETLEQSQINLARWANPDYLDEARTYSVELEESSGYSLEGSVTPDLVYSKLWLLHKLAEIQPRISTLYALGSWYGNLAMLAAKTGRPEIDKIINVEADKSFLTTSKKILDHMGVDNVEYMLKDANDLDYRQVDDNSVVVNTSLTDMPGQQWWQNIPPGTLVALQARDHDPGEQYRGTQDIEKKFPMSEVLYQGSVKLQDPETAYRRFMVIGRK